MMNMRMRVFVTCFGLAALLMILSIAAWASMMPIRLSIKPKVTIDRAASQAEVTSNAPILFKVVFSAKVTGFDAGDVTLGGTAPGAVVFSVSGSGTTYDVAVSGMTDSGTVTASLAAGAAHDAVGNTSTASTSTDNTVTYDVTSPDVTINQAAGQNDPINATPIHFTVVFSKPVVDFSAGDVNLSGTAPGAVVSSVSAAGSTPYPVAPVRPAQPSRFIRRAIGSSVSGAAGSGTTYDVAVSGMTGSGTVTASLAAGTAHDAVGNASTASTSTDNTVTYDVTLPDVAINQAAGQNDPTNATPIHFTVVFSKPVVDFSAGDVNLSGTAPGAVVFSVSGSGMTYDVAVSGMTGSGTVTASLAAGAAHDAVGNTSTASTSTDNTVTYDVNPLGMAARFGAFGGGSGMTNQGIFTIVYGDIGTTGASTTVTGFHDSTGDKYIETPLNVGAVTGRIYTDAPPPVIFEPGGPFGGNAATKAIADQAALDALSMYIFCSTLPTTGPDPSASGELSGLTIPPGVYKADGDTFSILPGGTLTLDAGGDADAVWVFQMGASLTVGAIGAGLTPARVVFKDGIGQAGNVYWQVGSAATINTAAEMVGTILASSGVTFSTPGEVILTTLEGRALSLNASVTMVNTIISVP